MKKLFIITGEHSGDIHAAKVVEELRKNSGSELQIEGIGGENLKNAGVKLFSDHKKMGKVGISFKIITDHFILGRQLVNYLTKEYKPDLVLMIDYGAFNLNISRFLKKAGIKMFYYIPPQVWASRKWRINTIKKNIGKALCIFPFEKELYESYGIPVHYCGHPLISQLPPKADRKTFFKKHGLDENKKLVSIFPGSRVFELKHLMKLFIKAAHVLHKNHPDLQFCVSQAPNLPDEVYSKYLKGTDFKVIKGENQALLSVSDALILASGTVALEAALYQIPMIIAYRGPVLFHLIYLMLVCTKFVSLPNIITGKLIVPELLQYGANVQNITYNIEKFLYDEDCREEIVRQLGEVKALLSDKNSAHEAALAIGEALC
ncbi:MAG: lipid-A-disaccharide synthase [Heliobacteriaceae bacterium]|jgi:lipid-A-disaccharide synthase|nr:lipid-A-disaccharide synthase [Heliobacteriaceae bacterium]